MNKQSLLWIIKYLSKKSDVHLPDTINDYFINNTSNNNITDISFYFHYIISEAFKIDSLLKVELPLMTTCSGCIGSQPFFIKKKIRNPEKLV